MTDIDHVEIIGLIAATLTTSAFLPQVYQTLKTKNVSGLNLPMLVLFFVGVTLWFVYGIYKESPALLIANAITALSILVLLYCKIVFEYRK